MTLAKFKAQLADETDDPEEIEELYEEKSLKSKSPRAH